MDKGDHIIGPSDRSMAIWIIVSFFIWLYCFRGFMTGRLSFDADAVAYYQHIKFFIDNLMTGTYPFWDPTINSGVPNEFFLRRMGSFSPFFMIIVGLRKIGLSHLIAYNIYLAIYYLVGAIGFYLLSRRLFRNKYSAYFSFLILYFSSLGTRQFDSYIILVFVPLVWFFYFVVSFFQRPQKYSLLGITFCLMNLATTYIPLYSLVILATFILFFVPIFPKETLRGLKQSFLFLKVNKLITGICCMALLISLIPGMMIFQSAGKSEFVMPRRGFTATSDNALEVGKKTITEWAILEELVYTSAFVDLRKFKFAIIYFPGVVYLILALGAAAKINRKLIFLFSWGIFLFFLSVPDMTSLYSVLYEHISFFKYFRNLHWFFWLAILPVFVLFVAELFDQLMNLKIDSKSQGRWLIGFIIFVHVFFTGLVFYLGNTLWTTYAFIVLSLIFCWMRRRNILEGRSQGILLLLTLMAVVQAVEVYHYLNLNAKPRKGLYKGDIVADPYRYYRQEIPDKETDGHAASLYYALKNYNDLYSNISSEILYQYKNNVFIVYEGVEPIDLSSPDYTRIEHNFKERVNRALVGSDVQLESFRPGNGEQYQVVTADSDRFQILKAKVDSFKIKTSYTGTKFLVVNNVFHRQWKAVLNGHSNQIIPANLVFQGVLLPAGENILEVKFGSSLFRGMNYFMLALFYGFLSCIVFVWQRDIIKHRLEKRDA